LKTNSQQILTCHTCQKSWRRLEHRLSIFQFAPGAALWPLQDLVENSAEFNPVGRTGQKPMFHNAHFAEKRCRTEDALAIYSDAKGTKCRQIR
jgi:hypothetical protein